VLIGSPIGVFIQYLDEHLGMSRSFTIATFVEASLWMLTTMIGLAFAMKGKIQQHRHWMTRSYAVAIVFLEVRVVSGLGGWHSVAIRESILWGCVALSLLFADIAIQQRDFRTTSPVTEKATSAVGSLFRSAGLSNQNTQTPVRTRSSDGNPAHQPPEVVPSLLCLRWCVGCDLSPKASGSLARFAGLSPLSISLKLAILRMLCGRHHGAPGASDRNIRSDH
jgi:hypothetical protein